MNEFHPFVYYDGPHNGFGVFPRREIEFREINGKIRYELVIIMSTIMIDGKWVKVDFGEQFFPTLSEALQYAFSLDTLVMFRPKFTHKLVPISDEVEAIEVILGCTEKDHDEYFGYHGKRYN